jgi:hypothetical protein
MRATASTPFIRPPRGAFRTSRPRGYEFVNAGKPEEAASKALEAFLAAVRNPTGGITSDDPRRRGPRRWHISRRERSAILADIAAGKQPHQIVASVRAALVAGTIKLERYLARCHTKSRRLRPPSRP